MDPSNLLVAQADDGTPLSEILSNQVPPLEGKDILLSATHNLRSKQALGIVLATVLWESRIEQYAKERPRRYRLTRHLKHENGAITVVDDTWTTYSPCALVGPQ